MKNIREVLRCDKCGLVQFRTVSGMCRKCDRPLSVAIPYQDIRDQTKSEEENGSESEKPHPKIEEELWRFRGNIRQIRIIKGLTQADVGRVIGLSHSNLARIECGLLKSSTLTMLQRVALGLRVDLPLLFTENLPESLEEQFPTELNLNIPMALDQFMEERDYSLRQLEERTDIHYSKISRWLGGYHQPHIVNIAKLAVFGFQITLHSFVSRVVAVSQKTS